MRNFWGMCVVIVLIVVAGAFGATKTWDNSEADGDFGNAANWTPAGVPTGGDDVIIDYGSTDIDTGIDQSAKDFASFVVGPNFTGAIGVSEATRFKCDSALLVINGGKDGEMWFEDGTATSLDEVVVTRVGTGATGHVYVDGVVGALYLRRGEVTLEGATTTAYVDALDGNSDYVTLNTTATITSLYVTNGDVAHTAGTITNVFYDAGTFDCTGGTVTNIYLRGGTFNWETDQGMSNCYAYGGTFDASGAATAKTLGSLTTFQGSSVNLDNVGDNLTVTSIKIWGGDITWSTGATPTK